MPEGPRPTIRLIVEIQAHHGRPGMLALNAVTERFDHGQVSDDQGAAWVGICTAINEYANSIGFRDFDCTKPRQRKLIMQETRDPKGQIHSELFVAKTINPLALLGQAAEQAAMAGDAERAKDMLQAMDQRLEQLKGKGHTFVRRYTIGRNDPCPCQSGRKFKVCHINRLDDLDLKLELLRSKDISHG